MDNSNPNWSDVYTTEELVAALDKAMFRSAYAGNYDTAGLLAAASEAVDELASEVEHLKKNEIALLLAIECAGKEDK